MEREYKKLVRDNIPDIITESGNQPITRILGDDEYKQCLFKKLNEEVKEFIEDESVEELCDVLEVIDALKEVLGFPSDLIQDVRNKKLQKNGAFQKKIFLEKVLINK